MSAHVTPPVNPRAAKRSSPATTKLEGQKWRALIIDQGNVTVRGGFCKQAHENMCVKTKSLLVPDVDLPIRFFHVSKREPWFCRVVTGHKSQGRGMDCVTVLDLIRDAVKEHWKPLAEPATGDVGADTPAPAAAIADSPATANLSEPPASTAPAASSTFFAPATGTAPADDGDDDDPLACIETNAAQSTTTGSKARAGPKRHTMSQRQRRWGNLLQRPVQLHLPNAPPCVADAPGDGHAEVWAMLCGKCASELWVDVGSLGWLVSYAADEHARLGVPHPAKRFKATERLRPNSEGFCQGLWRGFDHRMRRWQFEFVEQVDGLPPREKNLRRYFHISSITDHIWSEYGPTELGTSFADSGVHARLQCGLNFVYSWANAVLAGNEAPFLDRFALSDTAPAALSGTAPAATIDPVDKSHSDDELVDGEHDDSVC